MAAADRIHTNKWAGRKVALAFGLLLACLGPAIWLRLHPSPRSLLFWLCWTSSGGGFLWSLLALYLPRTRILKTLRVISVNVFVLAVILGVAEFGCRMAHVNFNTILGQADDPRAEYPVCFRLPDKPLGDIYFQRAGPFTWTGRPLSSILRLMHATDQAYEDEVTITTSYDADGFRNPDNQTDWDVVVVGDSFVESGALPFEQIFTTHAARLSGLSIRNLGVCNTGTLAHLEYLRRFGKGSSTRHAVLAFYDGNDVLDTATELAELNEFRATGIRPYRTPLPQRSLLKASYQMVQRFVRPSQSRRFQDAWLISGGNETPITMRPSPMPLDPETMTDEQLRMLADVVKDWAQTARELGMKPWLLYIPSNNRTYHGLVRLDSHAEPSARRWKPGTLPTHMQKLCTDNEIEFVDACGPMREAAEKGILVYNPILDTHLNAEGSRRIGELLAKNLSRAKTAAVEKTPK